MKAKIVITPELVKEMEENIRNSPLYQAKLAEAKMHVERSKESLKKLIPHLNRTKQ